jgi:hypothetical protein
MSTLTLRQDLPPDVTGFSSKFEDTRKAWRVTPFVRWGTNGSVARVYGQIGMGLYVEQFSNLNQQREGGVLVVDQQFARTEVGAGINLGVGLELFPISVPVGLTCGFRSHATAGGGDWFNTGEMGVVLSLERRRQERHSRSRCAVSPSALSVVSPQRAVGYHSLRARQSCVHRRATCR